MRVDIFGDTVWQMSLGERAAVEGVLAQLRPGVAVEIGTAEGACLRRIAAHAGEVHSFDLGPPSLPVPENATLHTGDSHALLPRFLAELAGAGRTVDFAMVDGDHSAEGVRRDLEDLLDSPAVSGTVILFHDAANEQVREGIEAVRFENWPKVAHVDLDWVAGYLFAEPALRDELWGGLGLVVVDGPDGAGRAGSVYQERYHPTGRLLVRARDHMAGEAAGTAERLAARDAELGRARAREAALEAEIVTLRHRIDGAERALANIKGSVSWRATAPLRAAKRRAAAGRDGGG